MSNKKLKKPIPQRGTWNIYKSEALDLLACEGMVMEFLHQGAGVVDDVRPITEISLFEFWEYIQKKKDSLDQEREQ